MNKERNDIKPFSKSLTIKVLNEMGTEKPLLLKVRVDDNNPHWYETMDKWSEEWCCIIHKKERTYGVYGLIDQNSGMSLVNGIYVVEFSRYSGFEFEKRRIPDIEIIEIDGVAIDDKT